jgi:hypothetical protein
MEKMTIEDFQCSREKVFERAPTEAQVIHDDEGIVMVIGSEGDARFPEPDDDDGPIVEQKAAAPPEAEVENGYFASR